MVTISQLRKLAEDVNNGYLNKLTLRNMLFRETAPIPTSVRRVKIEKVYTNVNPEIRETPCGCGGILQYRAFSFSSQHVEVGEIHGYKCDKCGNILIPSQIADELEDLIEVAKHKT